MTATTAKPVPVSATLFWANLSTQNAMSNKYQVDMSQLSDAAVQALEERGIGVRNKQDDRGNFITVKSNHPIKAYNTHGDEISCLVGNGSQAKAVIGHYDWVNPQGKQGRSASCMKMVITELNEYTADAADIDIDLEAAL